MNFSLPEGLTQAELALAILIMVFGAAVQGSVGLGQSLVAAPLLMLFEKRFVPGPLLVAAIFLSALIIARERQAVDRRGLAWAILGRVPGTAAGAAVVAAIPPSQIALPTALLVLAAIAMSAWTAPFRAGPAALAAAGAASGFMGTASSIGGPPIALVYQHEAGARLRGTLSAFFIIGGSISLAALACVGKFGPEEWTLSAAILPGVAAGFAASIWIAPILDRGFTRPAVLGISALAAAIVIVKHFWS